MKKILSLNNKPIFCRHNKEPLRFIRNFITQGYGNHCSEWQCPICKKKIIKNFTYKKEGQNE